MGWGLEKVTDRAVDGSPNGISSTPTDCRETICKRCWLLIVALRRHQPLRRGVDHDDIPGVPLLAERVRHIHRLRAAVSGIVGFLAVVLRRFIGIRVRRVEWNGAVRLAV